MKLLLILLTLIFSTTLTLSYGQKTNRDFNITFSTSNGEESIIDIIDNTNFSISTAIILIGHKHQIKNLVIRCKTWTDNLNRTYVLPREIGKDDIQKAVDTILGSQKLIDSYLIFLQLEDEFKNIQTNKGNI